MTATTLQIAITGEWQKVSESDCTMQSETENTTYDISVGIDQPTEALIHMKLDTPKTLAYKTPVWVRLRAKGSVGQQRVINIIK